jgi:type IV secretory pathway TrbL component
MSPLNIKPMPIELITLIAALIVSWLVFTALIRLVKTTISTAVGIAIIVLVLQLSFGIGPEKLWQQVLQLPQTLWHLVTNN